MFFWESCFGLLGNQTCVSFCRPSDLSPCRSGLSVSFSFSVLLFFCLFRERGGYRHNDLFRRLDSTRLTIRL